MSSWDEDYAELRKRLSIAEKVFIWFYALKLNIWVKVWNVATRLQAYAQKKVDGL
jgi:hypothetical protein